jgi:hypothetical protein
VRCGPFSVDLTSLRASSKPVNLIVLVEQQDFLERVFHPSKLELLKCLVP